MKLMQGRGSKEVRNAYYEDLYDRYLLILDNEIKIVAVKEASLQTSFAQNVLG